MSAASETHDWERRLLRRMRATDERHSLFSAGDRVLVAISGGKDSYAMLDLLARWFAGAEAAGRPQVELVAVHLDQQQPGYDGVPLVAWLRASGHRFEILQENTYGVVREQLAEGATYCSLCSRLRRGILYTAAERLGCNKLALGHHREDTLETFLLNLFYGGKLQAMPAKFRTDDGKLEVIRPLLECPEAWIARYAELRAFPIIPCNLCGSQENLKRERMGQLLGELDALSPDVRSVMMHALGNVRPSHLLDGEVAEAWAARPAHLRPAPQLVERPKHARALPILKSEG